MTSERNSRSAFRSMTIHAKRAIKMPRSPALMPQLSNDLLVAKAPRSHRQDVGANHHHQNRAPAMMKWKIFLQDVKKEELRKVVSFSATPMKSRQCRKDHLLARHEPPKSFKNLPHQVRNGLAKTTVLNRSISLNA